jgi:hypothetical protein
MPDIAFQCDRLARPIAAARATLARREVRLAGRILALALLALVALKSKALFSRLGNIGQPDPAWVCAAIAAETASLFAYSLMVGELLRLGGVRPPGHSFVRPSLVGVAMTASLPGGVAASNVYWWGALRRHGADRRLAALVMTGTSVAGAISLIGLLVVGVALAGKTGPLGHVHVWLVCLAVMLLVLRLAFTRPLGRLLTRALHRVDPKVEPRHRVRVRRLRLTMLFAYANWLLDCAALYASLQSVHAPVPARSVILVYVLAQLVAQLALLPGGGGTVELTLATGFAAFGHHGGTVLAGALLYRFLSCWGLIPVGWLGFILERARTRNRRHSQTRSARATQDREGSPPGWLTEREPMRGVVPAPLIASKSLRGVPTHP